MTTKQSTQPRKKIANVVIYTLLLLSISWLVECHRSGSDEMNIQNPTSDLVTNLKAPIVQLSDLFSFRSNKIVTFANNDFTNITGPALNIASEDDPSGLLIRPQMMNDFVATNFVGDAVQQISSHPEWIGDTFIRLENTSAVYISQINKINGELVNYRQRLVLNSTQVNKRLSDTFIMSGPYDGNYYRLGVNSDNKVSVLISDTQATISEVIFLNQTEISLGDAKAHHSQLTTLKILLLVADQVATSSCKITYLELDLQNPTKFSAPIDLVTINLPQASILGLYWSEVGKSIILNTSQDNKVTYNYYQIVDNIAKLTSSFSDDSIKFGTVAISMDTVIYSSSAADDSKFTAVEFNTGNAQPKVTTTDLATYNISSITSVRSVDVATFAVLGINSMPNPDNNWILIFKTGKLSPNEYAVHSVSAIPTTVLSTLSIPSAGYSKSDLALVGLLDGDYKTSFNQTTLKYMEMWRQGPHVVFDMSGVPANLTITAFAYNVSYRSDNGEIKSTSYNSKIQIVDPAPLSVIPMPNKVPMLDGNTYSLSDLVTINGYTSDISLKNTSNAFILPGWPKAKDYLNIQSVSVHTAVQGGYIMYEDQAEGLKLTALNNGTSLIKNPENCSVQKVGSITPENSNFQVFYSICKDINLKVATQSLFVAFVDDATQKVYTARYFLQTNSLTAVVLPTLKLSSPGSLTVAFVARLNQGFESGLLLGRFVLTVQVPATNVLPTQFIRQPEGWAASNLFDALVWDNSSAVSVFFSPTYSSKLSVVTYTLDSQGVFTPSGDLAKISFGADYEYHENSRLSCVWQQGGAAKLSVSCAISGNEINSYSVKFNLDKPDSNNWTQGEMISSQNVAGLNYTTVAWDGSTALLCGFNLGYKSTGAAYTSYRFWMQIIIPESADSSLQAVVATNDGAFKPSFLTIPNGSKMVSPGVSMNGMITTLIPQPTKIQIANAKLLSAESSTASLSFRDLAGKTIAPIMLSSVFFYKAPTPDDTKDNKLSTLIKIIVAVSAVVIICTIIALVIYFRKKNIQKSSSPDNGDGNTVALLNKQGDSNLGSIVIRDSTTIKDTTVLRD
jgi:hypothetical protein